MRYQEHNSKRTVTGPMLMSVRKLAIDILSGFDERLRLQAIKVDLDLDGGNASIQSESIRLAISALIENAIQAMPQGGELSVTIVNSDYQCELEIADSGSDGASEEGESSKQNEKKDEVQMLKLIPFQQRKNLEVARQTVMRLGGELESWECPQGGTANVLVFPIGRQRMAG